MTDWISKTQRLEHHTRLGTVFICDRADLSAPIHVTNDFVTAGGAHKMPPQKLASEVAEFTAWHALCIHPRLNGFQGYDCIKFVFEDK